MERISLRGRLTIFVTLIFGASLTLLSMLMLTAAEDELIANTRTNAEAVLSDYLVTSSGAGPSAAIVDPAESTRFFFLDGNGIEISEDEFYDAAFGDLGIFGQLEGTIEEGSLEAVEPDFSEFDPFQIEGPDGVLTLDPETGEFMNSNGDIILLSFEPVPEGPPYSVYLGDDVVAVGQTLSFPDGSWASIGVSSPLRPVAESVSTIKRLLFIAVPVLSAVIAALTWLAATHALKPVTDLTKRAQAIGATNIGDRLPVHPANDEIHELATTMNDMLARLDASQSQQKQFISDASHELRSPVAASQVQLEVARANPDNTDWPTTAEVVLAEQQRLSSLIDDLLALSRLEEAGAGRLFDIDLDHLVATEAGRPREVSVDIQIPEPVRITGNLVLITSAIRNLIDNASRHTDKTVVVSLTTTGTEATLHVDDDGPGIDPDDRLVVFERFTRLDEARDRPSGGSGLGLAITREITRAHGGTVEVADSPLGGARFTLRLPLQVSS